MLKINFQDVLQTQSTASFALLGTEAQTPDGSTWIYTKANEALSKGHVAVAVALVDVDTVSSSTDGDGNIVYITEASAGWTVGAYENAWVNVNSGTGAGQIAKIKTNTVDTLELYADWALSTALAVADSDIIINQWGTLSEKSAVTDKSQSAVGIAQVAFASADYGWVLRKGIGLVLAGEALTNSVSFVTGDDTEGQVVKGTTAKGAFDEQALGTVLSANEAADIAALVKVGIGI